MDVADQRDILLIAVGMLWHELPRGSNTEASKVVHRNRVYGWLGRWAGWSDRYPPDCVNEYARTVNSKGLKDGQCKPNDIQRLPERAYLNTFPQAR